MEMDAAERYVKALRKVLISFNTNAMRRFVKKHRELYSPAALIYAENAEDKYLRGAMAKMVLASNNMPNKTVERAKRILDELNWDYGIDYEYRRKN